MTEQQRQQLKILLNTFSDQKIDLETCIDNIVELFQKNEHIHLTTDESPRPRSNSIFDVALNPPPVHTTQRHLSSTYNEQGLVNNTDTVLYDNHDFD
ncbi:unnamed protein product [Adineta steineri]|uniref:Uncharacterized protein n=1 Tax=Adineta steineri TaxID=433720 RepID=A0A814KDS9_9BILA|nr:unnamed protein product [Adineta steineri]CAF1082030.1 unnamed protein product [Adineta steineri]